MKRIECARFFSSLAFGLFWLAATPLFGEQDDSLLQAEKLDSKQNEEFNKLREGQKELTKADEALLGKAAKYYVYRLTDPRFQKGQQMHDLVNETIGKIWDPSKKLEAGKQKFNQEFGKALVPPLKEVLKNRPIVRVSAARILAYLGKTGNEDVADPLVEIVEDKDQNNAVKLFAFQGLADLFRSTPQFAKKPEREAKCVQALLDFIEKKQTSALEDMGAYRYVRRSAIAALSQTRRPGTAANNKIERPTALVLLRALRKDGLAPDPDLKEQIEAAIGVCQLRPNLLADYQPAYAAQQVGYFLLDFGQKRITDQAETGAKSLDWRIQAARLSLALETLASAGNDPYVRELVKQGDPILKTIMNGQAADSNALRSWLGQKKCPAASVYKNQPNSVVKAPEEPGA